LPWQRLDLSAHAHDDETPPGFRSKKVGQLRREVGQGLKEVMADARDGPGLPPPVAIAVLGACPNVPDRLAPALVSYRALEPLARHYLAAHSNRRVVLAVAIERHLLHCRVRQLNDRGQPCLDHRQNTRTAAEIGLVSDGASAGSSRRICSRLTRGLIAADANR